METKIMNFLKENRREWFSELEIAKALEILDDDDAYDTFADILDEMMKAPKITELNLEMGLNSGTQIVRPDACAGIFYRSL